MRVLKEINDRVCFAEKTTKIKDKESKELVLLFDNREISKESVVDGNLLIKVVKCVLGYLD